MGAEICQQFSRSALGILVYRGRLRIGYVLVTDEIPETVCSNLVGRRFKRDRFPDSLTNRLDRRERHSQLSGNFLSYRLTA